MKFIDFLNEATSNDIINVNVDVALDENFDTLTEVSAYIYKQHKTFLNKVDFAVIKGRSSSDAELNITGDRALITKFLSDAGYSDSVSDYETDNALTNQDSVKIVAYLDDENTPEGLDKFIKKTLTSKELNTIAILSFDPYDDGHIEFKVKATKEVIDKLKNAAD